MSVGIIGLGRFGGLLKDILKPSHEVVTFDKGDNLSAISKCSTVFICVPIRHFEAVIKSIAPHLQKNATVIDTCSVKCHPVEVMQQHLPNSITQIATHPLFGPDSYNDATIHRIMTHFSQGNLANYIEWKHHFSSLGLTVIEMTPEKHDKDAAYSQSITHCLGRVLEHMQISSTPIDTLGFSRLLGIKNQTCNDTDILFYDLMRYNPYSSDMLTSLHQSMNAVLSQLKQNS